MRNFTCCVDFGATKFYVTMGDGHTKVRTWCQTGFDAQSFASDYGGGKEPWQWADSPEGLEHLQGCWRNVYRDAMNDGGGLE